MNTNKNVLALGLVALLGGATIAQAQDATVRVDGRILSFSNEARPFYSGRAVLVPVREMSNHLGVGFERNERGDSIRLTYRGDEAVYRKWRRDYELNGRTRRLPAPGQDRRDVMFVPVEIFRDLTDRDIDAGRGGGAWSGGGGGIGGGVANVDVRYRGERLRYDRDEAPRYERGTLYLPLRATARQTDVAVDRDDRGENLRLRYRDDTLTYRTGDQDFDVNGRRVRMNARSMDFDGVLYVPQAMFQSLIGRDFQVGGGSWNNRPDWDDRPGNWPNRPDWDDRPGVGNSRRVEIVYRDRTLSFGGDEQPFQRGNTVYVPLRAFASRLGVQVHRSDDGRRVRLAKDRDEVVYTQPYPYYELNGRRQNLRNGSITQREILFVPIDLFNVFTDGRLEIRRR